MNFLFNPENKFWNFVAKLTDVAVMSILWLICSLPIITIGASTASFYSFTMELVSDTEGKVVQSFFAGFKRCFKKATLIWLAQLAGSAFLAYDLWACWQYFTLTGSIVSLVCLSVSACVAIVFVSLFLYIYPILAVYDFNLKKLFTDSAIMAIANLHVTVTLFVLIAAALAAFYYISGLFFFWIGYYIFFASYFITGIFRRLSGEIQTEPGLLDRLFRRDR